MALPVLYWMLECRGCGGRRVVRDSYRRFVGGPSAEFAGGGYGGPPLEERYDCRHRCGSGMRVVGSVFGAADSHMWTHEPHQRVPLSVWQRGQWWIGILGCRLRLW